MWRDENFETAFFIIGKILHASCFWYGFMRVAFNWTIFICLITKKLLIKINKKIGLNIYFLSTPLRDHFLHVIGKKLTCRPSARLYLASLDSVRYAMIWRSCF